ncbi:CatB-related O-acetyltransferase [Roseobacter sp. GAI101]|uniref:CatB-related O-acetyltransferase n=1 Tax=Roseobacter sp. (strain GAI101) TaxID=391589 RepID=UPI0001871A13|nr:CatB-related O-acetyltransferase [Roseobacter sp. GAI101]EEB85584.1 acetyltransferase [Roseobacter sp. GAI101]
MSLNLKKDQLRWLAKKGVRINAPADADTLRIPEPAYGLEAHSTHSAGGVMPLGSYSYAHSFARHVEYVGRYCSIGGGLQTYTNTHPVDRASTSPVFYQRRKFREWGGDLVQGDLLVPFEPPSAKVRIGNDVWIGETVRIREGVSIGDGAIIAADALVTKDVAPFAVVGGVPARVIRHRFDPDLSSALLQLEWWRYSVSDLIPLQPDQPVQFAVALEAALAKGQLQPRAEDRFLLRDLLRTQGAG